MRRACILVLLCFSVLSCSDTKNINEYISDASIAIEKAEYNRAIIELKNALKQDGKIPSLRLMLGKAYLFTGNFSGSEKELKKALSLGADPNEVLPLLVRVYLLQNDIVSVTESINSTDLHFQKVTPEVNVELKTIVGIYFALRGYNFEGQDLFSAVLASNLTENFYYKLTTILLAAKDDQLEQAINAILPLVENDSPFKDALILSAVLHSFDKNYEQAILGYEQYLAFNKYNLIASINYVNLLIKQKRYPEANKKTDRLLKQYPNFSLINEVKAELLFIEQDFKGAAETANLALSSISNLYKSSLIAGISYFQLKNYEMAYYNLSNIESMLPSTHIAYKLLLELKFRLGYTEDALTALDNSKLLTESDFSLLSKASLVLMESGEQDKAQEYIARMDSIEATTPASLNQRGMLKLKLDNADGISDLEKAIELTPEFTEARLGLLYHYLSKNDFANAMKVADEWASSNPNEEYGYLARGIVYTKQNLVKKAKESFSLALAKNPDSIGATFNLAKFDLLESKYEQAFVKLSFIINKQPNHPAALNFMVLLSDKFENRLKVIDFIKSVINKSPKNSLLYITLSLMQESLVDRETALKTLSSVEEDYVNNIPFLTAYAKMNSRNKNYSKSEELFLTVLKISKNNYVAHIGLLSVLELQKKFQLGLTKVKESQKIFPNNENFKLFEVNFLLLLNLIDSAEKLLSNVDESKAQELLYLNLHMKLQLAQRNEEQALVYAKSLYEKYPNHSHAYRYANILQTLKQTDLALEVVESALGKYGKYLPLDNLLAELTVESSPEAALVFYQDLAKQRPDNYVVLNNLAWAAIQAKDYQLGFKSASKAAELSPDSPHVLDTLGVANMRLGDFEKAEKLLIKAALALPDNSDILLHYAEVLIHLNRFTHSKEVLAKTEMSANKQKVLNLLHEKEGN